MRKHPLNKLRSILGEGQSDIYCWNVHHHEDLKDYLKELTTERFELDKEIGFVITLLEKYQ